MLKHINLQLFAEETIPEKKEDANLENKPEVKPESTSFIRKAFGLKEPAKEPEKKPDVEAKPEVKPDDKKEPDTKEPEKKEPAAEEFIAVKHLGKEVKIPASERDNYIQMGVDYKFVKGEADKAKSTLQRIAQAEGFKTVDEYLVELDKKQKAKLAEQIEDAAGDPDKIDEIVKNHPEVVKTKEERRKLDYANAKAKLSEDSFFKKFEPELDDLMAKNPDADPNLVYSVLVGNYVRSDAYKEELAKEREQTAKEKKAAEEAAEKKVINEMHDKARRGPPVGGDKEDGKETVQASDFTKKLAGIFGVSASKIAQRSHEKMKRS